MSKINYKKFVEDWAEVEFGCLCCKNSGKCNQDCNFELDFTRVIEEINDDPMNNASYYLDINDYIENFYIDNEK